MILLTRYKPFFFFFYVYFNSVSSSSVVINFITIILGDVSFIVLYFALMLAFKYNI